MSISQRLGWAIIMGYLVATPVAQAGIYVYELPDGSRVVTDHAMANPLYKLVRSGDVAKGMGQLVAHQNPQFFRADPSAYDRMIHRLASENKVDFALVKAVMHVESAFNPYARSNKGALGLMQLLPQTAQRYGINDIYDPMQNIAAGVKHLRYLLGMFNNKHKLALAAYNAGEQAVIRHRGVPPYPETQEYVRKVMHYQKQYSRSS
ncbi:MAG: lytic transglycosylase domain-containing protein [Gammaproteobacteria bacterium]|nr:lytic transglycosylase domain-containing protein [Gammaproteobacteria bacterium]